MKTNIENPANYTNTDSFPYKVILDTDLCQKIVNEKFIPPVHVEISPTNKCNLNCSFCSYSSRDKQIELNLSELKEIIGICKSLGTKAITISGGGEPLCHPHINDFIQYCKETNIQVGLITNGLLLNKLTSNSLQSLKWCRVSYGDGRTNFEKFKQIIMSVIPLNPSIDWGFSYVVTDNPDYNNQIQLVKMANELKVSHVKFASDISNQANIDLNECRAKILEHGINIDLVQFHHKNQSSIGCKECRVSLLRPVISANGLVYPCCSSQYFLDYSSNLGHYTDLINIINNGKFFNGSICKNCFYWRYNELLNVMIHGLKHSDWL